MEPEDRRSTRKTATDSVVVMACTLMSRLLGIVKARAIATVFGATGIADVINFTFNIPNNFRKLFAEGALSSAYVPVFTSNITRENGGIAGSSALLARMQGFQLLVSVPLVALTWVFRSQIITFLSDFSNPAHIELSSELLVYFMVFLGTISFAALYGGVLQSHGSFFTAAAAPLLFSISVILSVYLASDALGPYSMALGVVAGGLLQACATFLWLRRYGYRMTISFDFRHQAFRQVMHGWAPVTVTAVIAIVSQQVAFYFASSFSEGTVTAFSNAIIIWQAPYGIFYSAIATVFFPKMVSAFHSEDTGLLGNLVSKGMVYIGTFLIPAAIVLTVFRNETTAVLLQSGLFTLRDTMNTGAILFWFTAGMPAVAWYGFLQRLCYSTGKFSATVKVGLFVAAIDIGCTWALISRGFGPQSLSLANTISYVAGTIALWIISVRRPRLAVPVSSLVGALGRLVLANLPLVGFCLLYRLFASETWWYGGSTAVNMLKLAGIYLGAVAIVIACYRLAKIEFLSVLRKKER